MSNLKPCTAAVAAVALLLAAAPASFGAFKPLGTTGQLNVSDEASLARTADGTLHVGWFRRSGAGQYDLLQTPVSAAGAIGAPVPIATGWASIEGPTLLAQGAGLAGFFSGVQTSVTGDPTEGIDEATSADGGATWSLGAGAVAAGDFASSRDAAVTAAGGSFVQAWYAGEETVVHAGLDRGLPAQRGYGSGTDQALSTDAAGAVLVAWCTGVQGPNGVYVQSVDPATGAAAGAAASMPGSTANVNGTPEAFCPANTRVPLVARVGGGFYVLSTDGLRRAVRLWHVGGAGAATLAGGSSFKQQLALAAAPAGRLWAGWMQDGRLQLRRSNPSATVFGATVSMKLPSDPSVYQLDLSGQSDRVDAVVRSQSATGAVELLHTQSYPGLSLRASGGRRAAFKVTDAGDPVAGATISVGGHRARTNGSGRVTVTLPRGRYRATASKARYVGATARLRVR